MCVVEHHHINWEFNVTAHVQRHSLIPSPCQFPPHPQPGVFGHEKFLCCGRARWVERHTSDSEYIKNRQVRTIAWKVKSLGSFDLTLKSLHAVCEKPTLGLCFPLIRKRIEVFRSHTVLFRWCITLNIQGNSKGCTLTTSAKPTPAAVLSISNEDNLAMKQLTQP